jgi:phytoene synthase
LTAEVSGDDLAKLSGSIIQAGSKSFAAAAKIFDPETRKSAYLLYAWCRHCDDIIDNQSLGYRDNQRIGNEPAVELIKLREMTKSAMSGEIINDPMFVALQNVAAKHSIPSTYPLALIDGFEMDVTSRVYQNLNDTLLYCYHVAGVVGIMMAIVMGRRDSETLDRANDLGLAFQLTNIARDVIEDAQNGRVYLPADWLEAEGIAAKPNAVADVKNRNDVAKVVRRLLIEADKYFCSSLAGLPKLGFRSAWAIATALKVYKAIGSEVIRQGPRAWDQRVSTSKAEKILAIMYGFRKAVFAKAFGGFNEYPARDNLWNRP